jgi:hypothetical protein
MQVLIELDYQEEDCMTAQHHEKVRVVIDCSVEERAYIKMQAARKQMTISEYFLSMAKEEVTSKSKVPNKTTLAAHKEALEGKGTAYDSMDDFWSDMGIKRRAKS